MKLFFNFRRKISELWYVSTFVVGLLLMLIPQIFRLDLSPFLSKMIYGMSCIFLIISDILCLKSFFDFNYNIYVFDTYIIIVESGKEDRELTFPFKIKKGFFFLKLKDKEEKVLKLKYNKNLEQFLRLVNLK